MNQLTEEQRAQLRRIRERHQERKMELRSTKTPRLNALQIHLDLGDALSLLDSQAAGDREAERVAMEGIKEGLRQRDERTATAMRDACVEKVKAMADEWQMLWEKDLEGDHSDKITHVQAANQIILALESLTLEAAATTQKEGNDGGRNASQ